MGAARFVAGQAAEAAVDGLASEAVAGCLDFGDDVASCELCGAGALMESADGVEDGVSAARTRVGELGLQRWDGDGRSVMVSWRFVLCKPKSTNPLLNSGFVVSVIHRDPGMALVTEALSYELG